MISKVAFEKYGMRLIFVSPLFNLSSINPFNVKATWTNDGTIFLFLPCKKRENLVIYFNLYLLQYTDTVHTLMLLWVKAGCIILWVSPSARKRPKPTTYLKSPLARLNLGYSYGRFKTISNTFASVTKMAGWLNNPWNFTKFPYFFTHLKCGSPDCIK